MSYMAGDYYAGDYYAGGIFGNVFRAVTRTVGGAVRGFISGGPAGAIGGAIGGAASATRANIAADRAPGDSSTGTNPGRIPTTHSAAIDTFLRGGGRFSAAGKAKLIAQHNAALQPVAAPLMLAGGGGRRRMNWANGRALGRAERRISMAVKHMSKYIRWVHPDRQGHAAPKFKKRKSR